VISENLIVMLAFVGGFASILAMIVPFLRRDPRAARLKAVAKRREELSAQQREQIAQQRARLRPQASAHMMKALIERLQLQNMIASPALRQRLAMAGFRNKSALYAFVFSRLAAGVGFPLVTFLFLSVAQNIEMSLAGRAGCALVAAMVGFYLPSILVKNYAQKRQDAMTQKFPDMLDLLCICVEAGLSIEAAFAKVTEEIAEDAPILAEELGLTSAELAFLGDRTKAYNNLAERTGLEAAKSLATTLVQSEKYGTPVGVALQVLSQEKRHDRMAVAEKKAGALPAQLTVPMIVFFLPVLFLVIIGPAIIQMMKL
jgi:tight adherence protein C